ncbi:MAG: ATP-binding protein [Candidatus Thermoplasmatota archaeon]|nr:ATP-binding protein [Candidatus Thermoplasmatota archaeon]MDP7265887.1 ATP-binding protein [Candidatus Thermoplasmatota archaeon]
MRTLCQHIFDLVQNSIRARAGSIGVVVEERVSENLFRIIIKDDGHGLKPEHLKRVKDAFFTTRSRKKRSVGLGIPLIDATCQRSGGELIIKSQLRRETKLTATMEYDNIDRPPLGDIIDLFASLLISTMDNKVIWTLEHIYNGEKYFLKNHRTSDELNILSYGEPGVKKKLIQLISAKEAQIHK